MFTVVVVVVVRAMACADPSLQVFFFKFISLKNNSSVN